MDSTRVGDNAHSCSRTAFVPEADRSPQRTTRRGQHAYRNKREAAAGILNGDASFSGVPADARNTYSSGPRLERRSSHVGLIPKGLAGVAGTRTGVVSSNLIQSPGKGATSAAPLDPLVKYRLENVRKRTAEANMGGSAERDTCTVEAGFPVNKTTEASCAAVDITYRATVDVAVDGGRGAGGGRGIAKSDDDLGSDGVHSNVSTAATPSISEGLSCEMASWDSLRQDEPFGERDWDVPMRGSLAEMALFGLCHSFWG